MVLALMEGGAKEITNVIIKAAKGGDLNAAKLVLDRLAPPMRERAVSISFPDTATAEGLGLAQQAILDGVGSGALLPGEATALASIVESRRKTLDTIDFERRLQRLEEKLAANKGSVA